MDICIYVYLYVCMYVRMYVCMHVCMCIYVCMCVVCWLCVRAHCSASHVEDRISTNWFQPVGVTEALIAEPAGAATMSNHHSRSNSFPTSTPTAAAGGFFASLRKWIWPPSWDTASAAASPKSKHGAHTSFDLLSAPPPWVNIRRIVIIGLHGWYWRSPLGYGSVCLTAFHHGLRFRYFSLS